MACLTANFTAAFNGIAAVAVPPFNMCEEIGTLGEHCYVVPEMINQTQFSYASVPEDVVPGNGVLPVPPVPATIEYRAGAKICDINDCQNGFPVSFSPPMSTANYAVLLSMGNPEPGVYICSLNESRRVNSFTVSILQDDCGWERGIWVYWLAIKINT